MKMITTRFLVASMTALLFGCAAQPGPTETDAIADFIAVAELDPLERVRLGFASNWSFEQLNENYVVLNVRDEYYLVEFRRRCRELNQTAVTPDKRTGDTLRPGVDTIRGCIIGRMFEIDKGQAEELEYIGNEP